VAVLGAGGGAAAVAAAARDGGHAVTLFNRSAPAGRRLGERLGCGWGGAPESLEPAAFALVVNAVPAGVPVPAGVAGRAWSHASVLDLAYGNGPTAWETLAGRAGIPYRGGLEFLVRQACGQIARWTGTAGDPEALREALR
jgi:shikimate dehydrogenase